MGIKHDDVKATGQKGFAAEWNKNHVIDGDVNMNTHQINDLVDPTLAQDAATKQYVDDNAGIYTAGEGIDIVANVISGEDATTANKGIASFNSSDFSVAAGAVSLKSKTSYWTIGGSGFVESPSLGGVKSFYNSNALLQVKTGENNLHFFAPVLLPHGAVVTSCIVYGNVSTHAWQLRRGTTGGGTSLMANSTLNSADSSISSATIDNSSYSYYLEVLDIDSTEQVYMGKITYTTDYD